jgi:EmrB/QacA subfamily drug resistance transporter
LALPTVSRSRKLAALAALCAAVFVVNVSTTIVNIALPTLVRDLGASTRDLLWIVDAFNLAFAALVLAAGSLSDRFGRKPFLLIGLFVFFAASLAGAWSRTPDVLIAWRALAGVAAAVVYPVTLSILANVFTERSERVKAISIWGAATGLSVAVGPVVGGAFIETFWWGSILVFNGAAAAIALLLALLAVPNSRDPSTPPLDHVGLLLSTVALGTLVYTIIEAPDHGWSSTSTLVGFVVAAIVLGVFVLQEARVSHPMLDVRLFTNLRFTAASGAVTSAFFALFGFVFLVTQYFQSVQSYGALETGVRMLPVAGSIAVASLIGPRLAVAIGSKLVVAFGLVSLSVAFAWASTVGIDTSYLVVAGQMIFLGAGIGLTSTPATEAIMGVVSADKAGMGSAVNDATRELGGTLGVAVIGSVALSVYRDGLNGVALPEELIHPARDSIGAALGVSRHIVETKGDAGTGAAAQLTDMAQRAFVDGFSTGCVVAAAVTAAAAALTLIYLPAHPNSGKRGSSGQAIDDEVNATGHDNAGTSSRS